MHNPPFAQRVLEKQHLLLVVYEFHGRTEKR